MKVYTDGACSGNPGPGGWAWATQNGPWGAGAEAHTTNQRMEVQAVLEVLKAIDGEIEVVSDSTYVVNCFNDGWYEGWISRGWRTAAKKPVANQDLWQPLIEAYLLRADEVTFTWVKGHSGDSMNDLVDSLAVQAAADQAGGSGGSPGSVDEIPEPESPAPWPSGPAVWVVGPPAASAGDVEAMSESIRTLDPGKDILVTGLRRGPELVAAEVAIKSGVQVAAVLPFADPAAMWPDDLLDRFDDALSRCSWIEVLGGDPALPGTAVRTRDAWCANSAVGAIVVGDTDKADTLEAEGAAVIRIGC